MTCNCLERLERAIKDLKLQGLDELRPLDSRFDERRKAVWDIYECVKAARQSAPEP